VIKGIATDVVPQLEERRTNNHANVFNYGRFLPLSFSVAPALNGRLHQATLGIAEPNI
jgi:hypothetical protein